MTFDAKENFHIGWFVACYVSVSLIYYMGYLYGVGIEPGSIPFGIVDVVNGVLTFMPAMLLFLIIIAGWIYKGLEYKAIKEEASFAEDDISDTTGKAYDSKSNIIFYVLLACFVTLQIYLINSGYTLTTSILSFILLTTLINQYNAPHCIPEFISSILKLLLIMLIIIFVFGFSMGHLRHNSSQTTHMVNLVNSKTYKGSIISYLSSGLIIKTEDKILFIPNANILSTESGSGIKTRGLNRKEAIGANSSHTSK